MTAYHLKTGVLCLLESADSSLMIETNFIMFAKRNFSYLFSSVGVFLNVCPREVLVKCLCAIRHLVVTVCPSRSRNSSNDRLSLTVKRVHVMKIVV